MTSKMIKIAEDFSSTPAGRYREDGPFPGEVFRDEILVPALAAYDEVCVDLSGVEGFGSSFLEEAFGGLVRLHHITKEAALKKIKIITDDPALEFEIKGYLSAEYQTT